MKRLKAYRQMDIEVGSYRKPQDAQIISTVVEYLQDIQIAKEAIAPDKNRTGNLANNNKHFTRADDTHMRYDMCSNALWR
jgi:endo-1,4-beta-mannosidase